MTNTKRKFAALAAATATVLALSSACSSSGSAAAPAVSGLASGTITWFANQFGPTLTDVRKTLIAGFEKAYSNIKVNLEQAPSDSDTYRSTPIPQMSGVRAASTSPTGTWCGRLSSASSPWRSR